MNNELKPKVQCFEKKIDKVHQRILLPKFFTDLYGDYYTMKVYIDKIEIIPSNEKKFKEKK